MGEKEISFLVGLMALSRKFSFSSDNKRKIVKPFHRTIFSCFVCEGISVANHRRSILDLSWIAQAIFYGSYPNLINRWMARNMPCDQKPSNVIRFIMKIPCNDSVLSRVEWEFQLFLNLYKMNKFLLSWHLNFNKTNLFVRKRFKCILID